MLFLPPALLALAEITLAEKIADEVVNTILSHTKYQKVQPKIGSIVHCALYGVEHSGIYIGNNTIVQLERTGDITAVSPTEFVSRTNALAIYVACDSQNNVLHNEEIAERAKQKIGTKTNYSVLKNNCHKFTAGCMLGDFNNLNLMFSALENVIKHYFFNQPLASPVQTIIEKAKKAKNLNLKKNSKQHLHQHIMQRIATNFTNNTLTNSAENPLCWRIWDNEVTLANGMSQMINSATKIAQQISDKAKTNSENIAETTKLIGDKIKANSENIFGFLKNKLSKNKK